jgi:hypothetical protein
MAIKLNPEEARRLFESAGIKFDDRRSEAPPPPPLQSAAPVALTALALGFLAGRALHVALGAASILAVVATYLSYGSGSATGAGLLVVGLCQSGFTHGAADARAFKLLRRRIRNLCDARGAARFSARSRGSAFCWSGNIRQHGTCHHGGDCTACVGRL